MHAKAACQTHSLSDCHFELSVQEVNVSVQGKLMGIQQGGA